MLIVAFAMLEANLDDVLAVMTVATPLAFIVLVVGGMKVLG